MGLRSYTQTPIERYRQTFNAPPGGYAPEEIVFGAAQIGDSEANSFFREITALLETSPVGATFPSGTQLELWLPHITDSTRPASSFDGSDYFNSAVTPLTAPGMGRWQMSAWPGAKLRFKNGGAAALQVTVSACGY